MVEELIDKIVALIFGNDTITVVIKLRKEVIELSLVCLRSTLIQENLIEQFQDLRLVKVSISVFIVF